MSSAASSARPRLDPHDPAGIDTLLSEEELAVRQTVRDFCSRFQVSEASFYAWRRILAERERAATAFVPVRVVSDAAPPTQRIEVVLGNGRMLRVSPGFDSQTLQQLLTLLES